MSLSLSLFLFFCSAVGIGIAGTYLSKIADTIADKTGWGEALVGAVLLGAATSLAGMITSITAAASGHPTLAVSNAIGGIAAQTFFIALADIAYRKANLEHASASLQNIMQGVLLLVLLGAVLLISFAPPLTILWIHPLSFGIFLAYIIGLHAIHKTQKKPLWKAKKTKQTVVDEPQKKNQKTDLKKLLFMFGGLAIVVSVCGYGVGKTGVHIAEQTGLSEGIVGVLFTAIATSLPELVTSISAVRRGAVDLAIGNILGGNTFDVLFLVFADIAYRSGSLYHNMQNNQITVITLTMVMISVLLFGLLHRQKKGVQRIGWASIAVFFLYIGGYWYFFSYSP